MWPKKTLRQATAGFTAVILTSGIVCAAGSGPDWKNAEECLALIERGKYEKVIADSKFLLNEDRWNADANACLVMAYYLGNRKQYALMKLAEISDALPYESVQRIHDILWKYLPEFLAEKEYTSNFTLNGGDCLLRNVKALKGNGFLIIGRFFDPQESRVVRHVTGYRCSSGMESCEDVDMTCRGCSLEEPEAVIAINDYRVSEIQLLMADRPVARNVRYIQKVLEIEHGQ